MAGRIPKSIQDEIERELSSPLFRGIAMGPTISEFLLTDFRWGEDDRPLLTRGLNRVRLARHRSYPLRSQKGALSIPPGRTLVTWAMSTPRLNDMILPVLDELDSDSTVVLYGNADVVPRLPAGISSVGWGQTMTYDVKAWRAQYEECRSEWERSLKALVRRFDLPKGAFTVLSLNLMVASQRVLGFGEFLRRSRPAIIVTEYDRNHLWSCLVLAANELGIRTLSLVHGVMYQDAIGFSPVLADKILTWGQVDRDKLLAAGEPEDKITIGGCPRLSRDLSASREQGRDRLRLDQGAPVILFGSSNNPERLDLVELFCMAVDMTEGLVGLVRLHPVEKLADYGSVASRHPRVRFSECSEATLDESLAAADVVVTCRSGVGSDALVKRRPVVVLSPDVTLSGPDLDLVERAGCPHARTPAELADILGRMLHDEDYRRETVDASEGHIAEFCGAFGQESARLIAGIIKEMAAGPSES